MEQEKSCAEPREVKSAVRDIVGELMRTHLQDVQDTLMVSLRVELNLYLKDVIYGD